VLFELDLERDWNLSDGLDICFLILSRDEEDLTLADTGQRFIYGSPRRRSRAYLV
jgi:hypothetical protein